MLILPKDVLYECSECGRGVVMTEWKYPEVRCTCEEPNPEMERVGEVDDAD